MKIVLIIICFFVLISEDSMSQSKQYPHFISGYDLFSPNFNANKDYSSFHFREEWERDVEQNLGLKILGINLFVPSQKNRVDISATVVSEEMSIGAKQALQLGVSKTFVLGLNTSFRLGIGLGRETDTYHQRRLSLFENLDNTKFSMVNTFSTLSFGCMILKYDYFLGASTNYQIRSNVFDRITGLDYRFGRFISLGEDAFLRVMMIGRYYKFPHYNSSTKSIENDFGALSHNLSLACSFGNGFWLGSELRFDQEWGVSIKKLVFDQLEVGYEYDIKKKNGVNRLNSHLLTVVHNF